MVKKVFTVTIGIPAYNESKNISFLLDSILKQEIKDFILEKIIVLSDGSTDDTDLKVKKISDRNKNVFHIKENLRLGKNRRLIQLYRLNTSDIFIQFDGDIMLNDTKVISKLVNGFSDENVAVVSANGQPIKGTTFIEKLINTLSRIWYMAIEDINNGDNIYNSYSCALALKRDFAKTLKFYPEIISIGRYIYCVLKQKGLSFKYLDNAVIYYRSPTNLYDYKLQSSRNFDEKDKFVDLFGGWVKDLYDIPKSKKTLSLIKNFISNPIYVLLAIAFLNYAKLLDPVKNETVGSQTWEVAKSTKNGFQGNKIVIAKI